MGTLIREAVPGDAEALSALAALTFPLACPPSSLQADIEAFIAANFTVERFQEYLADPAKAVLVADDDGVLAGYSLLVATPTADPDVAAVLAETAAVPAVELSKCYVHPDHHGGGLAARLMAESVAHGARTGAASVWLGVNNENARAIRFYQKSGFAKVGTKTFMLGERLEHDFVMVRPAD